MLRHVYIHGFQARISILEAQAHMENDPVCSYSCVNSLEHTLKKSGCEILPRVTAILILRYGQQNTSTDYDFTYWSTNTSDTWKLQLWTNGNASQFEGL